MAHSWPPRRIVTACIGSAQNTSFAFSIISFPPSVRKVLKLEESSYVLGEVSNHWFRIKSTVDQLPYYKAFKDIADYCLIPPKSTVIATWILETPFRNVIPHCRDCILSVNSFHIRKNISYPGILPVMSSSAVWIFIDEDSCQYQLEQMIQLYIISSFISIFLFEHQFVISIDPRN